MGGDDKRPVLILMGPPEGDPKRSDLAGTLRTPAAAVIPDGCRSSSSGDTQASSTSVRGRRRTPKKRTRRQQKQRQRSQQQEQQQLTATDSVTEPLVPALQDCCFAPEAAPEKQQPHEQQGSANSSESCGDSSITDAAVRRRIVKAASPKSTSPSAGEEGGSGLLNPETAAPHVDFSCRDFDDGSQYWPIAYLGRGAVGRVYHCIEKATGERVAVKVVSLSLCAATLSAGGVAGAAVCA